MPGDLQTVLALLNDELPETTLTIAHAAGFATPGPMGGDGRLRALAALREAERIGAATHTETRQGDYLWLAARLTSAYTGQVIEDPGVPAAGEVWIDRAGGGVRRVVEVAGGRVKYSHVLGGPRFAMSVEWLRKTATRA